jgi:hypothetical protein
VIPILPHTERSHHIGFDVTKAEGGAWVLTEMDWASGNAKHFACADNTALHDQMRAWVEREIQKHFDLECDRGAHLVAAREVSA